MTATTSNIEETVNFRVPFLYYSGPGNFSAVNVDGTKAFHLFSLGAANAIATVTPL